MTSLASLLTRDAVVPVELIERALERQTLEGGELDTALLELDAAPENVLAAYRAAAFRLEPAARGELLRIEPAIIDCISAKLARRFRVVPLSIQEGNLVVASASPLSDEARAQLETASATSIRVRIAAEVRIASALERHYGVAMTERLRRLGSALDARSPGALLPVDPDKTTQRLTPTPAPEHASRNRTLPMSGAPGTPRAADDAPVQVTRVVELAALPHADEDPSDTRPLRPSKAPPRPEPAANDMRALADAGLVRELAGASDRAQVERILLAHARERFACVVLLEVRDKHLLGRAAAGLGHGIEVESIDSAMSRALQGLVLAGQPRVLDLRRDCPGEALASLLDRVAAQPCAILPVSLGKRVVITLYADNGGQPISL